MIKVATIENLRNSIVATCLFVIIYYIYLYLNIDLIADSGFDSHRFYRSAILDSYDDYSSSDDSIVSLLRYTQFIGYSTYCPTLFFITCICVGFYKVKMRHVLQLAYFSPMMIFCYETGKDFLIIVTMLYFYTFLNLFRVRIFTRMVSLYISLMTIILCVALFYVKGVSSAAYFYITILMTLPRRFVVFSLLLFIPAGFFSYYTRGFVELDDIVEQTNFNSIYLVSTGLSYSLIYEYYFRALTIFTSPYWYWIRWVPDAIVNNGYSIPLIGYFALLIRCIKSRNYNNLICLIASILFAMTFPFVHLRYYFTFLALYFLIDLCRGNKIPSNDLICIPRHRTI